MVEEYTKNGTYLEYNPKKYCFLEYNDMIIMKSIIDDNVKKVFKGEIGFIIECYDNDNNELLVVSKRKKKKCKLKIYSYDYDNEWELFDSLKCRSIDIDDIRIATNSFIINTNDSDLGIYNLEKKISKLKRVYKSYKLIRTFNKNVIMVDQVINNVLVKEFKDVITYGIDPHTLKIVTPIWSELQQRFIDVYDEEKAKRYSEVLSVDEITIQEEVYRYLKLLDENTKKPNKVFDDGGYEQLNIEFTKKFFNH